MQNIKKISVVIPSYNRYEKLKQVIPSYIAQEYVGEIIVVDDGSLDDTYKITKVFPSIKLVQNKKQMGTAYTKNLALKEAKYDYIFIGEDDVELEKDFLKILLEHSIKEHADISCGRRVWLEKNEDKESAYRRSDKSYGNIVDYNLQLTNFSQNSKKDNFFFLLDACMLIKKNILKDVNFDYLTFTDAVAWRSESDFQLSAAEKGYKLLFCPHVKSFHLPKISPKLKNLPELFLYDFYVFKNNYKFTQKHKKFIKDNLSVEISFSYYFDFFVNRINKRYFSPFISKFKLN